MLRLESVTIVKLSADQTPEINYIPFHIIQMFQHFTFSQFQFD